MTERDDADGEVVEEEDQNENHRDLAEERFSVKNKMNFDLKPELKYYYCCRNWASTQLARLFTFN